MAHFPFRRKKPTDVENTKENLFKRYDGKHHRSSGMRFQRPSAANLETIENRMLELEDAHGYGKKKYLNPDGDEDHEKYTDLDTYYSTTKGYPRRLVVQATPEVHNNRSDHRHRPWGRRHIRGRVPFVITLAELCLNPFGFYRFDGVRVDKHEEDDMARRQENLVLRIIKQILHWITSILLTLTLSWIIPLVLSSEVCTAPWDDDGSAEHYDKYQNVYWHWPKHAINVLDQSPNNDRPQSNIASLTIPRRLVVKDQTTNQWTPKKTKDIRDKKTDMLQPYIFLSFSRANYIDKSNEELRTMFYEVAERMLQHENLHRDPQDPPLEAFWVDLDCVSSDKSIPAGQVQSKCTRDVNTISDAVRCAKRVYIVLPTESGRDKRIWGERIWTFPEVLLAANKLRYCFTHSTSMTSFTPHEFTLNDMYDSFWSEPKPTSSGLDGDQQLQQENPIGHLIKHYTNSVQLSELQLFTFAVQAMATQTTGIDTRGYTTKDMAYAAMGLFSYRLTPNDSDNVFQAIARLSLVNDSNQLLERLLCLSPNPRKSPVETLPGSGPAGSETILHNIAEQDQYGSHLWDIKPLCDVVGVGDDLYEPTVIVDRCRGIPIRWKDFPRLTYTKNVNGFSATISRGIVYRGTVFIASGFAIFLSAIALSLSLVNLGGKETQATSDVLDVLRTRIIPQYLIAIGLYFGVALVISWFSPWAVRKLCSDSVQGCSSQIVGFEGTMPLHDLEKIIYGNFNTRLSYTASSTVFSERLREANLRLSKEPDDRNHWENEFKRLRLPNTHRLFTLVDTGNMTVSVISAERPPVVALICGREGGMLRVLLCSWRFEKNCLYREGVIRMRSSIEDQATQNDWLKISLASQGDVNRTRVSHLKAEAKKRQPQSPTYTYPFPSSSTERLSPPSAAKNARGM
ncbi:hypothetical protein N7491_011145 [Penicillium cf. griseofulvum]|uniref:Uncharacterized protein n=1 Tax=Penicillium cf. griseofulvum TaxID=2972120 RepID=A0A9W9T7F2_9EURO|nr:hypothetical protein N7472_001464 [Penicillium cf. griseofulvum]KAJ5422700.1 hypothetical protein N7491_011145 [Penicillium cf. griseofulvum]KAJ5428876.1 hypothetical protein N7445_010330 [Penicillium cf. griseofulvum]